MNNRLNENTKYRMLILLIMLCSAILLLYLTTVKEGMHVDEYLTYGLANNHAENGTYLPTPEYGVKLSATDVFDSFLYTETLDIQNVWINQGNNVHPPLYYLLFHCFLLITNHFLGIKTGALLNIIFHMINIGLVWLVMKEVLSSKYVAVLGTGLYAFLPIVLGNVLFIRMYVLLATFILLVTLWFIAEWDNKNTQTSYVKLGIISVCGALTHYYFLLYLFFCCLIWGIRILIRRRWKDLAVFLTTMTVSGILCLVIFPYIPSHVFSGKAGKITASTFLSMSDFIRNLKVFWKAIDNVYGGFLVVALILVIGLIIHNKFFVMQQKYKIEERIKRWMIIIIPCICYLVIVTKIAIYAATRYIAPMYGICLIAMMLLADKTVTYVSENGKVRLVVMLMLIGIVANGSWKSYGWSELHLEAKECVETARKYGINNECIYVQGATWRMLPNYQELLHYQNITFIHQNDIELLFDEGRQEYDHVVIYFDKNLGQEKIEENLQKLLEVNEGLETFEKLHEYTYSITYYLE